MQCLWFCFKDILQADLDPYGMTGIPTTFVNHDTIPSMGDLFSFSTFQRTVDLKISNVWLPISNGTIWPCTVLLPMMKTSLRMLCARKFESAPPCNLEGGFSPFPTSNGDSRITDSTAHDICLSLTVMHLSMFCLTQERVGLPGGIF